MCVIHCFSHVCLFGTLYTIARQSLLSIGFSRQEYGSGLPCPPPGDLPDPGIKPVSLMSPELAGVFFTTRAAMEDPLNWDLWKKELTQQAGVSYTSYITMKDFLLWLGIYLLEYFWNVLIMFCMLDASSVQFSLSVVSNSLWPHGLQYARLPCPSPTHEAYSNSCPLSRWCHPSISSSVIPFSSHVQSFPASGFFSDESVLCIRWPKY